MGEPELQDCYHLREVTPLFIEATVGVPFDIIVEPLNQVGFPVSNFSMQIALLNTLDSLDSISPIPKNLVSMDTKTITSLNNVIYFANNTVNFILLLY
jgi:hypothetical protein